MQDSLYPAVEPYANEWLEVGDGHELYVEQCGNPAGIPAVFLHGGPGAGCCPSHRRFFDPERYRVILFDQRGCGRSRPHASVDANTTWDLVADIERLRAHLGVERWLVFGGSWGSTLALAYAEQHPQAVAALVLRGIFLCRPEEIHWFYQQGANRLFPDYWQDYLAPIPPQEQGDLLRAYADRLFGPPGEVQTAAARAWSLWEGRCATLRPDRELRASFGADVFALALARIECHYFLHNAFFQTNQLLRDIEAIRALPGVIVHGRYDAICPLSTAWELHQAWPEAELNVIPDAGHAAFEPGIARALIAATDRFAHELSSHEFSPHEFSPHEFSPEQA